MHSLWRMVLEEIKFQLHLRITPTPGSSSDQLSVSCTNVTDELLCNHQVFFSYPRKRQQSYPAHNRLPVAAKPQAGDVRNFGGWFKKNKITFYVDISWCRRIQAGCSLRQVWCRTHFSLDIIGHSQERTWERKGRNICRHWLWKQKRWAEPAAVCAQHTFHERQTVDKLHSNLRQCKISDNTLKIKCFGSSVWN